MTKTKHRYYLELLACFAITMIVFWLYTSFTKVPIIHGDESGYLLNAAAFAGYRTDAFSSYYPGYSLPISLAFLGNASPDEAYDRIQAINALFWAIAACVAYALVARLRPQSTTWQRILVVSVTLLYPAFPVFASLALSENLFVPVVLLLALVLFAYGRNGSWGCALLAGALGATLTLAHPKGALVCVAAAMAMLVNVRERPLAVISRVAVMLAVTVGGYLLLRNYLDGYLREMLNAKDLVAFDHYPGVSEMLEDATRIFTWAGFSRFVAVLSGQALYLVIGSLGLVFVGAWWSVSKLWDGSADRGERALAVFSLFSLLAVYAFSVFFMKDGVRADHVMYGRYSESVIAPLLMLGALCLPAARELKWAAIVALALATLVLFCQGNPVNGSIVVMNVTAVEAARKFFPGVLNVMGLAIAGAVLVLVVRAIRNTSMAMVFTLLVFVANALVFGSGYLAPGSAFRGKQHSLVEQIERDFPGAQCVNYDMGRMSAWERNNYQFYLLPLRLDSVAGEELFECGDLLISNATDLHVTVPDAVLIGQEFGSEQRLWTRRAAFHRWLLQQTPLEVPAGGIAMSSLSKRAPLGLRAGWYGIEQWGVWSKPSAHIVLTRPKTGGRALRLEFNTLATNEVPRILRISCNGTILASREYRQSASDSLVLEADDLDASRCNDAPHLVLDVEVTPASSPNDLGMSADMRAMGIGLKKLEWVETQDGP